MGICQTKTNPNLSAWFCLFLRISESISLVWLQLVLNNKIELRYTPSFQPIKMDLRSIFQESSVEILFSHQKNYTIGLVLKVT